MSMVKDIAIILLLLLIGILIATLLNIILAILIETYYHIISNDLSTSIDIININYIFNYIKEL